MNVIEIYRIGEEAPVRLAARELRKYLVLVSGKEVIVRRRKFYDRGAGGLWVGTFTAFTGVIRQRKPQSEFDDEIHVDVAGGGGVIAGVNARSVLLAAYRYLTELGCRWIRPGKDGQVIPLLKHPLSKNVSIKEKPSVRHRCVCIEGAVSWQHVRDMIEWMPKLGFNGYFVQFREAYEMFARWYHHELNPRRKQEEFSVSHARALTARIWRIAQERGLILQMVGHGWTCEPFGVRALGWMKEKHKAPERIKPYLAEIDGKRQWFKGIPMNTQLCYSNARARRAMVESVADYAGQHPDIPVIFFLFADGSNNHCECPKCRKHLPADWYVKVCNEIDAELTRRNLPTKIAFDIYSDCLWPPKTEKFRNPDRFIMVFAPITRTYTDSLAAGLKSKRRIAPFKHNKLDLPKSVDENLAYLRAWQRLFQGDSYHFDYHLMWDHYLDLGHYLLAEVLHEDIRQLGRLGLNGWMNCQVHRCSLPSSLLMIVTGRTLWDRSVSFDEVADDVYRSTFGPDWRKVKRHTQRLSNFCDPPFFRGERTATELPATARKFAKIPGEISRFAPVVESNLDLDDSCQAQSWRYLKEYGAICLGIGTMLQAQVAGDDSGAAAAAEALYETARRKEPRLHRVFDVRTFIRTITVRLSLSSVFFGE